MVLCRRPPLKRAAEPVHREDVIRAAGEGATRRTPRDRDAAPGEELDWDDDLEEDSHARGMMLLVGAIIGIVGVVAVAAFR